MIQDIGPQLLTDAVLALLLLITIGYAVVLNKKLAALRNLRGEMEKVFGEFSESTRQAEASVSSLRERAEMLGGELKTEVAAADERLGELRTLNEDLRYLSEKGQSLADQLESAVAQRHNLAESSEPTASGDTQQRQPERERSRLVGLGVSRLAVPASAVAAASKVVQSESDEGQDSRSRELISALDAIR